MALAGLRFAEIGSLTHNPWDSFSAATGARPLESQADSRIPSDRTWAIFFARMVLGLIFFMAGVWKVFGLGPTEHARRLFVDPYADSFLPLWSLWATGTVVPFLELAAGALLLIGYRVRPALLTLGGILVLVTFGHLLAEPLYQFHTHVIPRLGLLLFLLWTPSSEDRLSLDGWLTRRRTSEAGGSG